jgi:hypothetical protein
MYNQLKEYTDHFTIFMQECNYFLTDIMNPVGREWSIEASRQTREHAISIVWYILHNVTILEVLQVRIKCSACSKKKMEHLTTKSEKWLPFVQ